MRTSQKRFRVFAGATAVFTFTAIVCGMAHSKMGLVATLQHEFMPATLREFMLPPCPLCWAARIMALLTLFTYWQARRSPAHH